MMDARTESEARVRKSLAAKAEWLIAQHSQAFLLKYFNLEGRSALVGWRNTGRIHKRHFPKLASLAGTVLDWWIDPDAPIPPTAEWQADANRAQTAEEREVLALFRAVLESDRVRVIDELRDLSEQYKALANKMLHEKFGVSRYAADSDVAKHLPPAPPRKRRR